MYETITYSRPRHRSTRQSTLRNHNLEEQAQALYKSWFVDFEPFKDGKFVESELGMIPEGWHVCKLDTLVNTISGYSYKGYELVESSIAMATIKNFDRNGGFKVEGYKEIAPTKTKEEHFLKDFDLLVAHTDLTQAADIIGNPALVLSKGKYEKIIMSMDLCKVKSRFTEISNSLLYSILKDRRFKSHALGYVNGTTVLHMSRKAIGEYKIAIPSDKSLLKRLSTNLDSYIQKEATTIVENNNLETLRDSILPKLMSGELKINEIDC